MTRALTPADIDRLDDSPYYELVVTERTSGWYAVGWLGVGRDGKEYGDAVLISLRAGVEELVKLRRLLAINHADTMDHMGQPVDFTRRP